MLAHNIVDVQHILGVMNIADGLSHQYKNTPGSDKDGSTWTISPNWGGKVGLAIDINQITAKLLERFKEEPIFKGVIEAIQGIKSDLGLHKRKRAQHRAANYMIEDGRLWYVGGGTLKMAVT